MAATGPRFAFTDVDHTLLRVSTLHHFARHFFTAAGREDVLAEHAERMQGLAASGADRETLNKSYYLLWAGVPVREVAEAAEDWHEGIRAHHLYREPVVRRLRALRAEGVETVLVSGSFRACLRPIERELRCAATLCTELEERDGVYTGVVVKSLIGAAKRAEVEAFAAGSGGHDFAGDHAFGDHISDAPVLAAVGHPVVVPVDPALETLARERGWEVLRDEKP
ncbi:HAD family hydrolase [Nocardia puris]|uniref:HAD superfamily hydrolase (TIGR01490 family) n=1 Tax=Nocardia puris TaxID=208602 RepID=A0A366D3B7_9NOCA|nr:HAD-IB family hydrolase [Nocardia puris]RBO84553.1 HAD superfamily hydrolase (TIGR01490 family) [Nocardia puris]